MVVLLGIFRRAQHPCDTNFLVIYDTSSIWPIWEPPKVLNVLKLMGKHFIDPKSSEILSIFQVFPCTTQIALDIPVLLKSWKKH
jgi:hypothetical protein